jgi:F-type H+-transporting ATPase subunit c
MLELTSFIHTSAVVMPVALTAVGSSLGGGLAGRAALDSISAQPQAKDSIVRALLIGMALIETASIIGLIVTLYILNRSVVITNPYQATAALGAALAIALPGMAVAYSSARTLRQAVASIARQPFFGRKILNLMILTQSLIQTPLIFGFIVSMVILSGLSEVTTATQGFAYLASGLCLGFGTIGPTLGLGTFAASICHSVGKARGAYSKLLTFALISGAVIETPNLFALVVSILLAHLAKAPADSVLISITYLSAGMATGLGTIGAGATSGKLAAVTAENIAVNLERYGHFSRLCMLAQGLVDTNALYALIVSLVMLSR